MLKKITDNRVRNIFTPFLLTKFGSPCIYNVYICIIHIIYYMASMQNHPIIRVRNHITIKRIGTSCRFLL